MSNSTHDVVVYKLGPVENHPNADRLDVHHVFNYRVISQKGLWKEGDLVAYVPPDNIVPDTEEWAWLEGKRRIRAKKLRGVISYGLITKAPEGSNEGDIVTEQMGITHYEPPSIFEQSLKSGPQSPPPPGYHQVYDLDALLRYSYVFEPNEMVYIVEKLDGSNWRASYQNGTMYVGSHKQWKIDTADNTFWKALRNTPGLEDWLMEHPGLTVYGEIVPCQRRGDVRFTYGRTWGEPSVILFDIMSQDGEFFTHDLARGISKDLPWAPVIDCIPFNLDEIEKLATGTSLLDTHCREGIVITPVNERTHKNIGRIKLKLVSHEFLNL